MAMIPTRVNLLSPQKRKYLETMSKMQFFKSILEVCVFVLTIIGISLIAGWWLLQQHFLALTEQITSVSNKHAERNRDIRDANQIIAHMQGIQSNFTLWTPIIVAVTAEVPPTVSLQTIAFDAVRGVATFVGRAATRDDLLAFQASMNDIAGIADLEIPLSQLAAKEDISFSVQATLDIAALADARRTPVEESAPTPTPEVPAETSVVPVEEEESLATSTPPTPTEEPTEDITTSTE